MRSKKIPCTVGILTRNSGATLERALESVRDFADIVICDGGSSDSTLEIARRFGARIIRQDPRYLHPDGRIADYAGVRNQCLDVAKYEWFLYIDSDESISSALREDIERVASRPFTPGDKVIYRVPRRTVMDGRIIEHSSSYPGYQTRFFNKRSGGRYQKPIHERIYFGGGARVGTFVHPWYTYSSHTDEPYLRKTARYRAMESALLAREPLYTYPLALGRALLRASAVIVRSARNYLVHGLARSAPVRDEAGRALYPLLLVWDAVLIKLMPGRSGTRKLYVVINARMPSEKAHGIQAAKVCEALIETGYHVTLVVPARAVAAPLKEFYGLRVEVPAVTLPSLTLGRYERTGFALMAASFMLSSLVFLRWRRVCGERFYIYTIDIDSFSYTLLPLCGRVVAEMHSPKRSTILNRFFFKCARIVATNPLIAQELEKTFKIKPLVEPNGVDESFFDLSGQGGGALYVGRLYQWKGLEILPAAQKLSDVPFCIVGGTREEFEKLFGPADNIRFASVPPAEVPRVMSKADLLLLTGTAKNDDSNRYTSPMKVFEYLASGKPVVASATEALKSIIPDNLVTYCAPDDSAALARAVQEVLHNPGDRQARIAFARQHTWAARARRITERYLG